MKLFCSLLFLLFCGSLSKCEHSTQKEVFLYYDDNIQSSMWLPFDIECNGERFDGNKCPKSPFLTKISGDEDKILSCAKTCEHANISEAMELQDGFSLTVFVYSRKFISCNYHPNGEKITGIKTTVYYEFVEGSLIWDNEYVRPVNCTLEGISADTSTERSSVQWMEVRTFARVGTRKRNVGFIDVLIICFIVSVGTLLLSTFWCAICYGCTAHCGKKPRYKIEYIGTEEGL